MRWEALRDALAELPDSVILSLSDQVRQEIARSDADTGVQGEDRMFAGGRTSDWIGADGRLDPGVARDIMLYKDLALGWKLARACAMRRLPLPAALAWDGDAIFRAYAYLLSPGPCLDREIRTVMGWTTGAMATLRTTLEALLLSGDATPEYCARQLNVSEESVRVYEHLFFNVSARRADAMWLAQHVYPNTRMVEFYEGYVQSAPFKHLLRRAGVKNGADHVLQLAGISYGGGGDALAASTNAAQLEACLISTGLLMAQNGWGNERSNATAIFHSRHLMTAAKLGGEDSPAGSEYLALSGVIWEELMRVKKPEAQRALILQRREAGPVIDVVEDEDDD